MILILNVDQWDQPEGDGIIRRFRGEKFEAEESIANWLINSGSAFPADSVRVSKSPDISTPKVVEQEPDTPPDDGGSPEVPEGFEFPNHSEHIDVWRKAADELGVDVKGIREKRKIIAAVKSAV